MDKQLLKAYIRTIVEEEVTRLLPELLSEAVSQIKQTKINETTIPTKVNPTVKKPPVDRARLAELMGIDYDRQGGTLTARGAQSSTQVFNTTDQAGNVRQIPASQVAPEVVDALTKDYSQLMKAMKLT
jgi:hypothetical protein